MLFLLDLKVHFFLKQHVMHANSMLSEFPFSGEMNDPWLITGVAGQERWHRNSQSPIRCPAMYLALWQASKQALQFNKSMEKKASDNEAFFSLPCPLEL